MAEHVVVHVFGEDLPEHIQYHKPMYNIISYNMNRIIPQQPKSDDEDFIIYYEKRILETSRCGVKTAVAMDCNEVCGFFQFSVDFKNKSASWQEMQIKADHQGDGKTFPALLKMFLLNPDYEDIKTIHGYINNKNAKSQSVFTHIGFHEIEKTERGVNYICPMQTAVDWYLAKYPNDKINLEV